MKHSRLTRLLISTIGPALVVYLILALPTLATPAPANPFPAASLGFSPPITTTKTEEAAITSVPLSPDAFPRDLSVSLSASGKVEPGRNLSFVVNFANLGTTAADNVVVTNTLPAGMTLINIDYCTISPTVNGQQLVWQLGQLPPGNGTQLGFTVQLTTAVPIGTVLVDTAQIASNNGDDNPINNQATLTMPVTAPYRDLNIAKSLADPPLAGATATYVIVYQNQGSLTANNLIITDVLPASVTFLGASGPSANVVLTGSTVVFTRSLLAGDSNGVAFIDVKLPSGALPGSVITNVVRVSTTDPESSLINNVYTLTTNIVAPNRDLYVSQDIYSGTFQAGEQATYYFYFSNDGNYTATDVIMTDTLPAYTSLITWTGYAYLPGYVDLRGTVTPTIVGNQVVWNFGALGPDSSGYIYPLIQIDNSAPNGAVLTNLFTASTGDPELSHNNNSDSVTGVVTQYGGPDASGYRFKDETMPGGPAFDWMDVTNGTRSFMFGDDRSTGPVPLGFPFFFYGRIYTTTYLGTNGYLSLDGSSTYYSNKNMPNPRTPNTLVAPFWDDLQVCPNQAPQAIYFKSGGSAPNRYFVTEWAGVSHLSAPTKPITFEVVLHENGEIFFQYQSLTGTLNSTSAGVESYEGLRGLQYEFNQDKLIDSRAIRFTPQIVKTFLPVIYR